MSIYVLQPVQDYKRCPVTLVLGCCRPAGLFLSCLPMGCRTRMAPYIYDLPSEETKLEAAVKGISYTQHFPCAFTHERFQSLLLVFDSAHEGIQMLYNVLQYESSHQHFLLC